MGKQSRRKNGSGGARNQQKEVNADDKAKSNAVVQQIRHADPKTRHATLIALQSTLLHPTNKRVSLPVLQAVREAVMDSNLDCAIEAAACLVLFLSSASNDDSSEYKTVEAGWTLILLGRLEHCHQGIHTKESTKQWWGLSAQCLKALCFLIEGNALALERANSQNQTFLSTLFALLGDAQTHENCTDTKMTDFVTDTAIYAARSLHSSLDDNPGMVCLLGETSNTMWSTCLSASSSKLPELAQLHLSGSVIICRQITPSAHWQSFVISHALPCLLRNANFDAQRAKAVEEDYRQAKSLWEQQKTDDKLEQDIIRAVNAKKEPARDIAKRQKENPREDKSMFEAHQDGRQATEDALLTWSSIFTPLQLALELATNLLSCLIKDDFDDDTMVVEKDESMNPELMQALQSNNIPDRMVQLLQKVGQYSKDRQEEKGLLHEDLCDTISKISACLANCVLSNMFEVDDSAAATPIILWNCLKQHAHEDGIGSVMVVAVQRHEALRQYVLGNDLDFVFDQFMTTQNEEIQRDGVCLLAAAANSHAPHPVVVIHKVSECLLRLSSDASTSVSVLCEVLNALMDIYSQDDRYRETFQSLGILGHFQRSVVMLQKQSLGEEERDMVFNAQRFVEYKQER
jgi:hypothetical protein